MTFYFFASTIKLNDGRAFVVLNTTPKTDKTPCTAGVTYQLAVSKAVEESLPAPLEDGKCYAVSADEWWLDKREGKPTNLLHGKNLVISEYVKKDATPAPAESAPSEEVVG